MTDQSLPLPDDLAIPQDDGRCDHLPKKRLPDVKLRSTQDKLINPSLFRGRVVIFVYPRTGRPGVELPEGWDQVPGARGCTPQNCAFRNYYKEIKSLGAEIYGLSCQDTEYQKEMALRLRLPFEILSDQELVFSRSLNLPTFTVANMILIKRLTLITQDGIIEAVHYPVFPSDADPIWVIDYIKNHYQQ